MTPGQLVKTRKAKGLTQARLGELLGFSRIAVNTWEKGRFRIPEEIETKLVELGFTIMPDDSDAVKAYTAARTIFPRNHAACMRHVQAHYFSDLNGLAFTPEDAQKLVARYPDILAPAE